MGGGEFTIDIVNIPFIQHGKIKICTIGDSQTWWGFAGKLRKEMNNINGNILFVGNRQDAFGYPHEGEGGNNTKQVLNRLNKVPQADYYTLLLGTNDYKGSLDESKKNIIKITSTLLMKYTSSKIVYITPLPTINKERDNFNTKLKNKLVVEFKNNDKIDIIDVGQVYRENPDWAEAYLTGDGLHQNVKGVELMAYTISSYFKNE
ncbi:MAG: GDSL-type esterase/lipase family protein [Flavobacteriaceae bacterium]